MTIAVLLVASALATAPQIVTSAPADPGADSQVRGQPQRGGQPRPSPSQRRGEGEQDDQWGERPHRFGVGGSLLVSNRGASGGVRYWFGDRLGVNFTAGWYTSGGGSNPVNGTTSSMVVIPSVLFMLTKPNETRQMDVRPYVGGGLNYSHAYGAVPVGRNPKQQNMSGTGYQAFGGVEVTFRDMDMMTLSGEGVYYVMPSTYVNSAAASGFTYVFAVHFYLLK